MGAVIGELLPLALGVAISPIPIIAVILMLLSPRARVTALGFMVGWFVGIVLVVAVFTLLSSVLPEQDTDASRPIRGVIQLVIGAGLLLLALRQWRGRSEKGEDAKIPKWMQALDTFSFPKALGLGLLLSAVNPKNLLLAASAGVDAGSAGLTAGPIVLVLTVFTVIAASTVTAPVIAYLFAADRLRGPLDSLRTWLTAENAVIMAVLLVLIGASLIGKGIASF